MLLTDVLPAAKTMSRRDKLQLIRELKTDLETEMSAAEIREEFLQLVGGVPAVEVWSKYEAGGTAEALQKLLDEDRKAKS